VRTRAVQIGEWASAYCRNPPGPTLFNTTLTTGTSGSGEMPAGIGAGVEGSRCGSPWNPGRR